MWGETMLIKTEASKAIMDFLKEDLLVNQNIIGIIENMPEAEIFVDDEEAPKGVLVKKDDYMHYLYTQDDQFIEDMCNDYLKEGFFGFSGVKKGLADKIRARYLVTWESPCTIYYMPKENFDISLKRSETQSIRLEDAETVDRFYQYRNPGSLEAIKRDITRRPSSAIYVDGEIVCWVLVHDDNSMGIMYTKEEHRRKGYAVDVTIDLVRQILEQGKLPYLQIVKSNGMSPGLAQKCGFVEDGKADWFGIIAGTPKELIEANEKSRKHFLAGLPEILQSIIYNKDLAYRGLYLALHSFKYYDHGLDGVKLLKVETEPQQNQWLEVVGQGLAGVQAADIGEMLRQVLKDPDYNLYVLQKNGEAIAASATHKYDIEERGLYLLSLLPEYRNEDMEKLLASETVQAENNGECFFMVTQMEGNYVELLKTLGFRESHIVQL